MDYNASGPENAANRFRFVPRFPASLTTMAIVDERTKEQLERICAEVIAPLVRTDGGELHLLRIEGDEVHIHLSGACAGCPGAALTSTNVILPALQSAAPKVRLVLTTGVRLRQPDLPPWIS
jgi:Fe-S cluster biogenesis protein NfuA